MSKKPLSFQLHSGDWMKDPELQACSIFSRGLLVELLCLLNEVRDRGRFTWTDGAAWSDVEIVGSVRGREDQEQKISGLLELINKGVLERDDNGAVYSSRMMKDESVRKKRSAAGSKGGTKTQSRIKHGSCKAKPQNETRDERVEEVKPVPPAGKIKIPPDREDLDFHADKIGLPPDEVDKFVNFYASKAWFVGKNKMKSWKHSMTNWKIRWEERRHENGKGNNRDKNDHGWPS